MGLALIEELEALGKAARKAKGTRFSAEYLAYLASPHWQARRRRIQPKRCSGCGTTERLELNHTCYPPKGSSIQAFIDQPDSDFAWLCHGCHQAITQSNRNKKRKRRPKK